MSTYRFWIEGQSPRVMTESALGRIADRYGIDLEQVRREGECKIRDEDNRIVGGVHK